MHRRLSVGGYLFLIVCVISAFNAVIYGVSSSADQLQSFVRDNQGILLFVLFVLFIPVLVAYVTGHPNRRSFWWKCALSCLFPPAFFYLLVTALHETETAKVQKPSTGDHNDFITEQF